MAESLRPSVFFLYPNSIQRRQIDRPGNFFSGKQYTLYGKDQASRFGFNAIDDLDICEPLETSAWGHRVNRWINRLLTVLGAAGGDWYKVWKIRRRMEQADTIFSVSDRVGIPLVLGMALHFMSPRPIVYVSIGLPERLQKMNPFWRRLYLKAMRRHVVAVVAYGAQEALLLAQWLGPDRTHFIPFGVDADFFSPEKETAAEGDYILSIGADPHRDYKTLFKAAAHIKTPFKIVTLPGMLNAYLPLPAHVEVLYSVPFDQLPKLIQKSRFVVLPVRPNTYSGATTTLLQCMAEGKAVIVSQTPAIDGGYDLIHQENVLFVPPEKELELRAAIELLESNADLRARVGRNARDLVLKQFTYDHYCERIFGLMRNVSQAAAHA